MTPFAELPQWAMWWTAFWVLLGAVFSVTGAIGLLTLPTFFERIHAPTISTSMGTFSIALGSMGYFSAQQGQPVLHEILILVFLTVTTPITFMVLARAVLHRHSHETPGEGAEDVSELKGPRT